METRHRYLSYLKLIMTLSPLVLEETTDRIKSDQMLLLLVFFLAETAQVDHPENYLVQLDFYCKKGKICVCNDL